MKDEASEAFRELLGGGGNAFVVGRIGESVCVLNRPSGPISRRAAANLAAWLIIVAELTPDDLREVMAPQGMDFKP